MDILSSGSPVEAVNHLDLLQQHQEPNNEGGHGEVLGNNDNPMDDSADADNEVRGNQKPGGLDPQAGLQGGLDPQAGLPGGLDPQAGLPGGLDPQSAPGLPGGLQCGGSNFYSTEFAEMLFRSLPFMISQPKKRFLRNWQTDTTILPELGVPIDGPTNQGLEEIDSQQLGFIQRQLRKALRPERARTAKAKETHVYRCEDCPETFDRRRQLRHHVGKIHLQTFNCPKCSRLFSSPTNAKRHSLNCKGIKEKPEKPERAEKPKKLEKSPGTQRTLMKRWQCLVCKKKLTTIPHIYRHFQTLHPNEDAKASVASIGGDESIIKEEPNDDPDFDKERRRQRCQCNICGKTATRYFLRQSRGSKDGQVVVALVTSLNPLK